MNNVSIRLQNSCLQPFPEQAEKGPIIDAQTQHRKQLVTILMVEKAFDVGLCQVSITPVLWGLKAKRRASEDRC